MVYETTASAIDRQVYCWSACPDFDCKYAEQQQLDRKSHIGSPEAWQHRAVGKRKEEDVVQ